VWPPKKITCFAAVTGQPQYARLSFLWLDALPIANQQESHAGPHLFSNY